MYYMCGNHHQYTYELLQDKVVAKLRRPIPKEFHQQRLADNHHHVVADTTQCRFELKPQVMAAVQ